MISYNACDLTTLIKKVYRKNFNVPYLIMQDQRLMEFEVSSEKMPTDVLAEFSAADKDLSNIETNLLELFEMLLNDLCYLGQLEAGEYLIRFDD